MNDASIYSNIFLTLPCTEQANNRQKQQQMTKKVFHSVTLRIASNYYDCVFFTVQNCIETYLQHSCQARVPWLQPFEPSILCL